MAVTLAGDLGYAERTGLVDHAVIRLGIIRKSVGPGSFWNIPFKKLRRELKEKIKEAVELSRQAGLIVNLGADVPEDQWLVK